jgi:hypothetical protein
LISFHASSALDVYIAEISGAVVLLGTGGFKPGSVSPFQRVAAYYRCVVSWTLANNMFFDCRIGNSDSNHDGDWNRRASCNGAAQVAERKE